MVVMVAKVSGPTVKVRCTANHTTAMECPPRRHMTNIPHLPQTPAALVSRRCMVEKAFLVGVSAIMADLAPRNLHRRGSTQQQMQASAEARTVSAGRRVDSQAKANSMVN